MGEENMEVKVGAETGVEGEADLEAEIKKMTEQLRLKEEEAKENYNRFLRSCAELENFKKRTAKEKEDFIKYAQESMVRDLLPVLDNLERAVEHSKASQDFNGLVEGVAMTVKQFFQCLDKFGVAVVTSVGERFDPAKHEAIMQVEEGDYDADTVVGEHQKGYIINDRLLRPSLVTVAKGRKKFEKEEKAGE